MRDDAVSGEAPLADLACEEGLTSVHVDVFFLVGNLVECEITSMHRALVGSFTRVNAHVIKEIVPFSEKLPTIATFFGAHKHADPSACFLVNEFHLKEILRVRDVDSSLKLSQITCATVLDIHLWNFSLSITFHNESGDHFSIERPLLILNL